MAILFPNIPDTFFVPPDKVADQIETARLALTELQDTIGTLLTSSPQTSITFEEYTPGAALSYASVPLFPGVVTTPDLSVDLPVFLGEYPALPEIDDIILETMPEPFFARPSITVPPPPDITFPEFTVPPPTITMPDLPSAPSVSLPSPPVIEEVVIPAPPDAVVPEFEGTAPNIDLTPPTIGFSWSESAYTSELMTDIKALLEADVATGGSGYSTTVEQAIYDREVARTMAEEEKDCLDAMEDAESRGWMLPPGETMGKLLDLSDKINKRREETNANLVAQQTELAQRNTHLAWTAAVKVETILLKNHSNVQRRSYEAARFALSAAIELYKAKVAAYRAKATAFSVLAKVYEARIRAEIVKAELYKAHIEGLKTGVEANKLKVEAYKAQLQGIHSLVSMYRAEMEAGRVITQIEKTRVLQFSAQVEAYKARVSAIQAQYDGYIAQVRGEELKADIVKADANAAKARARAYEAQAEAQLERARAAVERIRAELIVYKARVDKYAEEVRLNIGMERFSTLNEQETADLRVIQARLDQAQKDLQAATFNAQVTEAIGNINANATTQEAMSQISTILAEVVAQAQRAATEAATAIIVATNASDTTSSSENHRQSTSKREYQELDSQSHTSNVSKDHRLIAYADIHNRNA